MKPGSLAQHAKYRLAPDDIRPIEPMVDAIQAPQLASLVLRSDREDVESAWYGHVPFAHWLVQAIAPKCIVELGAHNGVSYSAFCRAVQHEGLGTQCFAVDTWAGDEHAGFYGEDVYRDFRAYHDTRFGTFSTLIRATFDEALAAIPDRSVDLLHIDGRHGYDDVQRDFQSWRGKLSDRAVVLLHDTNVRERGFGVWRLWAELQQLFPSFEFLHAHGLGVLAVGSDCPAEIGALTSLQDSRSVGAVRERFAYLGERGMFAAQVTLLARSGGDCARRLHGAENALAVAQAERDAAQVARGRAESAAMQAAHERLEAVSSARAQHRQAYADRAAAAEARDAATRARAGIAAANALQQAEAEYRAGAEAALDQILRSSSWRATRPLRTVLSYLPARLRRPLPRAMQAVWRTLTPHLNSQRQPASAPIPVVASAPAQPGPTPRPVPPAAPAPSVCYVSGEPDTPGTTYRVDRYAAACAAIGARVTVLRLDALAEYLDVAGQMDIVVIWRARWTETLAAFVAAARAGGARIVFDVDDLMIDPALGTTAVIDGIRSLKVSEAAVQAHYAEVQRTMLAADYGSASTAELAGHMRRFGRIGYTLPNGFDMETLRTSRLAVRRRAATPPDGLLRLGYASGSRTHQRDFAEVAPVLPALLRDFPQCRLVLFQSPDGVGLVDLREFPDLLPFASQVEWRDLVTLRQLPDEVARFDVNLAPLQADNPFCAAKSELKYFEGALAGVCTVASAVGPYARVIQHGSNGYLATSPAEWTAALTRLLQDPALRRSMARTALLGVLWSYGPDRRAQLMRRVLAQWQGGPAAADAFLLERNADRVACVAPVIPDGEVVFSADQLGVSEVTVVVPLHNYAHTLIETLQSVHAQTLRALDLVIVDDASGDDSLQVALAWVGEHASRFNRAVVIRNLANAGLGATRNAAFAAAETPYVLPLDADNLLRPGCCELLLAAIAQTGAAFAYPVIQEFGGRTSLIGTTPYDAQRFVGGNYVDAMALIATSAWCAAGGYAAIRQGWEDYDFWCAVADAGLSGFGLGGPPLADYRVHGDSMLAQITDTPSGKSQVIAALEQRHPWVSVARPLPASGTLPG